MKIGKFEIKPEINDPIYYLHLVMIVLIVYFLVNQFIEPMEITMKNVLLGAIFVGLGDIIAHTILQLD